MNVKASTTVSNSRFRCSWMILLVPFEYFFARMAAACFQIVRDARMFTRRSSVHVFLNLPSTFSWQAMHRLPSKQRMEQSHGSNTSAYLVRSQGFRRRWGLVENFFERFLFLIPLSSCKTLNLLNLLHLALRYICSKFALSTTLCKRSQVTWLTLI